MLLSRFSTRFVYQYGISGCKLQMRTGRQTAWFVVFGSRISGSFTEQNLKVMNMSRTLSLLVSTLLFLFVSLAVGAKSDYLTWKWHPNKIYTRFLRYCSVKLFLLLQIKLVEKQYCCLRALIFSCNFSEELSRENKMNLLRELYVNYNFRCQNIFSLCLTNSSFR